MNDKYNCDNCGKEMIVRQLYESEHHFCCRECQTEFYFWDHNERIICKNCEKEFVAHKCYHKKFCTPECRNEWMHKNNRGKNHPRFNSYEISCDWCKNKFYAPQNVVERNPHHFCNSNCRREWFAQYYSQTEEYKKADSKRMVERMSTGRTKSQITKPHLIISNMMKDMGISHINEYPVDYFVADICIADHKLLIEVMGDYWHCSPIKYQQPINKIQRRAISRDRQKRSYIKKFHGIDVLYIWEKDINDRLDVCRELILLYIKTNGELEDYNSFNYSIVDGKIQLNKTIIEPHTSSNLAS